MRRAFVWVPLACLLVAAAADARAQLAPSRVPGPELNLTLAVPNAKRVEAIPLGNGLTGGLLWGGGSTLTPSGARAQAEQGSTCFAQAADDSPKGPAARDDGRRTMHAFGANLLRGTVGFLSTDNVKPLLIGGTASGLGAIFDDDLADAIADPDNGFGKSLESGAEPAVIGGVVAVLFATGRAVDVPRYRAMTYDWAHAFLINAGYTVLVKEIVRRERPDGSDNLSFPSGHASNAFALAAVAERHYGWKAGVPAYALAGAVAVSRLQRNKHYLSDVLAGSTLGYIVGRTVVRVNGQPLSRPQAVQLSVSPVIGRRTRGIAATVTF